ncbi:MAG: ATP-dependent transcriptional regulator, MalT-like, LuxR family, partial [Clostridiales bacterium]|nr:ATP-dependent transcriptional regulator, MalT-like, LuxR family [Clostridiales bacterium]
YHIIDDNRQVGNLIELIVHEEIPNLHIVLTTRTRPKFNHINLLSKGLCYYIDTDTLAFTMEELVEYFILVDCQAVSGDIKKIYNYTKGWISAVYLLMLGLKKGLPVNEVSNINMLVEDNLFGNLSIEAKDILLRLSVLDSFTMQQAVTVIGDQKVTQIISFLEEKNAFIGYDGLNGTYKLHNVLLDFLREKLAVSGMDVSNICYRAGKWYLDQGEISTALDYYYRADKIEELFEYLNSKNLIDIGYLGYELMQKIYSELPHDLCVKYPFTFLQMARNFIISGYADTMKQGMEIVKMMKDYYLKSHELPKNLRNKVLGELEVVTIFMVFNDAKKMVEHSRKAYELLDGSISCVVFWHNKFTFGLPHFLYTYYREPGRFKETVDCILEGFPPAVFGGCGNGCGYTALGEYAIERLDTENAEFYSLKSICEAKTKDQIGVILCCKFTLMRLAILKGDAAEARELLKNTRNQLNEMREEMSAQNSAIYNATLDMCAGYIYGCLNMPDMIPEWLKTGDLSAVVLMLKGMAFPDIIRGKAIMLAGNWLELEALCESFMEDFEIFHNQLGILHNSIYKAAARFHLNGMEDGIAVLLPALKEAEADGIILPFAENADFILPMLYMIYEKNMIDREYIEAVIKACEQYSKSIKRLQHNSSLLTEREVEVLKLLSQGLTQKEIARGLYVSVSSVKRYLESIYHKMEVNNKVAAIKNAEKLNIL